MKDSGIGSKVEIRPDAPVNSSYKATVSVVDRIIDAASGNPIAVVMPAAIPLTMGTTVWSNRTIGVVQAVRAYVTSHVISPFFLHSLFQDREAQRLQVLLQTPTLQCSHAHI